MIRCRRARGGHDGRNGRRLTSKEEGPQAVDLQEKSGAGDGNRTRMTSLEVEGHAGTLTRRNVYQHVPVKSARESPLFPLDSRPVWHGSGTDLARPKRCSLRSPISSCPACASTDRGAAGRLTPPKSVTSVTSVTYLVRGVATRLPARLLRLHLLAAGNTSAATAWAGLLQRSSSRCNRRNRAGNRRTPALTCGVTGVTDVTDFPGETVRCNRSN